MRSALLAVASLAAGLAALPTAASGPEIAAAPVALDGQGRSRGRIGRLIYRGGIQLTSADPGFGGLSSLRWHRGRLHAVIDEGGWISFAPVERGGRLIEIAAAASGRLHGPDGEAFADKRLGDAESLARDGRNWLVGFEREHRILRYGDLAGPAVPSGYDPIAIFGPLGDNEGIEAMAAQGGRLFLCAERLPGPAANCALVDRDGAITRIALAPPRGLDQRVGFPTDADFAADGTLYVLFRSWSGGSDNRGAVIVRRPDGRVETLALFLPPGPVDNLEGLAVREEGGRTYLYIASDDNFSRRDHRESPNTWQRTLLMKFEVPGRAPVGRG